MMNDLKKFIIFIIISLCVSFSAHAEETLKGKVIWCSFSNEVAVALTGYKFLNNYEFETWGKSSLIEKEYTKALYTSNFNYIFLNYDYGTIRINRTTLEFTASGKSFKDLTLNDGKNCEVSTPKSNDFEKLFDLKYAQIVAAAKKLKKI